ncbi:hypothetical protein GU808_24405 [Escherichia coli]|nr:hypothetical protein [Escherichia coli]
MSSVKVKATIVEDNTGIKSQLPILITEQGEVGSVPMLPIWPIPTGNR